MRVRFHLDEHVPFAVAAGLRRRGANVTCVAEATLLVLADQDQLLFASLSGRVFVTHDADILRLHAAGVRHAGIIYCRQGALSIGEMLRRLKLVDDMLTREELSGQVEYW